MWHTRVEDSVEREIRMRVSYQSNFWKHTNTQIARKISND